METTSSVCVLLRGGWGLGNQSGARIRSQTTSCTCRLRSQQRSVCDEAITSQMMLQGIQFLPLAPDLRNDESKTFRHALWSCSLEPRFVQS